MALDAYEEDLARPFGVPARGGSDGAAGSLALFAYTILTTVGTTSPAVPAGAKGLIAHAIGGGGTGRTAPNFGGGGAAYAQSDVSPVSDTSTISATVGSAQRTDGNFPQDGTASSVSVNGTVIALAEQGYAATATVPGRGGLAANCIGKTRRSGGTGGTTSISSTPPDGGFPTVATSVGGNAAGNFGLPAGGLGSGVGASPATAPGGGGGNGLGTQAQIGYVLLQWLR